MNMIHNNNDNNNNRRLQGNPHNDHRKRKTKLLI